MSERVRAARKARENTKCGFHSWKQTIRKNTVYCLLIEFMDA
jgi:hypothetical protein